MKFRFLTTAFLVFVVSVLFSSCSYVTRPVEDKGITWEEVEAKYVAFEKADNFTGLEGFSRELLIKPWARWQKDFIRFKLANSLYIQGKYKKAINIFELLRDSKQFRNKVHLTAGSASLRLEKYDKALKWVLKVYLDLQKSEKIEASKIIFLSYLYSERIDKAALWYSRLNEDKRKALDAELKDWSKKNPAKRKSFDVILDQEEGSVEQKAQTEEIGEKAEEEIIEIEKDEDQSEVELEFDRDYEPEWNSICVALSLDEKWLKFNAVIKDFTSWYFLKYKGEKYTITFLEFSDPESIEKLFATAKEKKCFGVAGPFFSDVYAEDFIEQSVKHSIPIFTYNSFVSDKKGLLFNAKATKDIEAQNLVKYTLKEKEKKTFGLVYIDDFEGRKLRDIYWKAIESQGGRVTGLIPLSADSSSYFNSVAEVVGKPDEIDDAVRTFKWNNKDRYSSSTLMNRALERFLKKIPGKCGFEALVVLTPTSELPLFIPSFPYLNVEFDFYQKYLKRSVKLKEQDVRKSGYDWKFQTLTVLSPSELVESQKVIERLGRLVDGMIVFASENDFSDQNQLYTKMSDEFKKAKERDLFYIEKLLGEVFNIVSESLLKSEKKNIGSMTDVLKEDSFQSVMTGLDVRFDAVNRLVGKGEILIGRKKEPFMTLAEIQEQEKKRAEDRNKERNPNKDKNENDEEKAN